MTGSDERPRALAWVASTCIVALWLALVPCTVWAGLAEDGVTEAQPSTAAIRFYQDYLSSLRHGSCRFSPSCSQYAVEAIEGEGLFTGSALAADRLLRCNGNAWRFHARNSDKRLIDPVRGTPDRLELIVPGWLLPPELQARQAGVELDVARATLNRTGRSTRAVEAMAFGETLAAEGDCERAATEYLRAAFLTGGSTSQVAARRRIGDCGFAAGAWAEAEVSYLMAGMLEIGRDRAVSDLMLAASCRFNQGDAFGATGILLDLTQPDDGFPPSTSTFGLLGLSAMRSGAWDNAQHWFDTGSAAAGDNMLSVRLKGLSMAAAEGPSLPHRSPGLASAFAVVLPGSGHMYAGRSQDGLRHLFVNGALIWSVVALARSQAYAGAVLVAGVTVPFYTGNIYGAGRASRAFNRQQRVEHTAAALARMEFDQSEL